MKMKISRSSFHKIQERIGTAAPLSLARDSQGSVCSEPVYWKIWWNALMPAMLLKPAATSR